MALVRVAELVLMLSAAALAGVQADAGADQFLADCGFGGAFDNCGPCPAGSYGMGADTFVTVRASSEDLVPTVLSSEPPYVVAASGYSYSPPIATCSDSALIAEVTGVSIAECRSQCDREGRCTGFEYSREPSTAQSCRLRQGSSMVVCVGDVHDFYRKHPKTYGLTAQTCAGDHNIFARYPGISDIMGCAELCDADPACRGFEYAVDHGGAGGYVIGACNLVKSVDTIGCDGAYWNVDLYHQLPDATRNFTAVKAVHAHLIQGPFYMPWSGEWEPEGCFTVDSSSESVHVYRNANHGGGLDIEFHCTSDAEVTFRGQHRAVGFNDDSLFVKVADGCHDAFLEQEREPTVAFTSSRCDPRQDIYSFQACLEYLPDDVPSSASQWRIVRHLPSTATTLHPATDNLAGTETYGSPTDGSAAWSVPFGSFNEVLLATGDGSDWLITTPLALTGEFYTKTLRDILQSSISTTPYQAEWYNREIYGEDPLISVTDLGAAEMLLVYGEAGILPPPQ